MPPSRNAGTDDDGTIVVVVGMPVIHVEDTWVASRMTLTISILITITAQYAGCSGCYLHLCLAITCNITRQQSCGADNIAAGEEPQHQGLIPSSASKRLLRTNVSNHPANESLTPPYLHGVFLLGSHERQLGSLAATNITSNFCRYMTINIIEELPLCFLEV